MKKFLLLFISCVSLHLYAQSVSEVENTVRLVADAIVNQTRFVLKDVQHNIFYSSVNEIPDSSTVELSSPYNDWRYWNGVLNIAMLQLGRILHDDKYKNFALQNVAFGFEVSQYFEKKYQQQNKWSYPFGQFFIIEELDDCGAMGASVLEVYQYEKDSRYKAYIDKATHHIVHKQTRLRDGTFVRSFPVRWTLWADDLYMSIVFLSRMGYYSCQHRFFDDAAFQIIRYHELLDTHDGLMVHNWYSDTKQQGVACWGRANGWAVLAQIDLLERLPKKHPLEAKLLGYFRRHLLALARYQSQNGLWHQLLNKPDSYEETSCTAMFTYAFAKAVTLGILPTRYASVALRGWQGVASRIQSDGTVEGVCTGTVVSDNLVDYYHRPAPLNDVHGMGTILLAGGAVVEMLHNMSDKEYNGE